MGQEVKSKMVLHKISQAEIAEQLCITPGTVSAVVNGHRKSRRVQKAIADALGVEFESLWTDAE